MPIISKPQTCSDPKGKTSLLGAAAHAALSPSSDELQWIMTLLANTKVERVATKKLKTNAKNAKRHPQEQVKLIAKNMRIFGFTNPLLIDQHNNIIAGHARYSAALQLGLPEVPTIRLSHLTAMERRALALADNKLPELGTWNEDILAAELRDITDLSVELSFEPEMLGFDLGDIDRSLKPKPKPKKSNREDQIPTDFLRGGPITQLGHVWACGEHLVACRNPLDEDSYSSLLGDDLAHVAIADTSQFLSAHPDVEPGRAVSLLATSFKCLASHLVTDAVIYMFANWRYLGNILGAAHPTFGDPIDVIAWLATDGFPGDFLPIRASTHPSLQHR